MAGRIKIEPYKPLDVHTPPVPGGGYIQVDASAGKFAPSPLARMGLDMAQGLPSAVQAVSAQLARDDEAAVKDADARLGDAEQALLFDPQSGYFNAQGEAALAKAPQVLDAYAKAQEREVYALPNDAQRQMLEELAQRRLATFGEQVNRHSTAERQRWYDTTSDRRIALMQADAGFHWSDDALLRRALGTVRAEVRDKAERHGWDSPLTEAALRQQTSRTLVSAIEAAVERNPERARSLRTRYDQHIEATDRAALDALLTEAQTRQRAQQASAEILNSTPPDGQAPTLQWQLQQAEAIAEPGVRAATLRTLLAITAAAESRARALAEQVLARVLKDVLTDPSQIPVREWVALDANRRQAIETRIDYNAAGTEPVPNPSLVDELATQMVEAPSTFARRDLVPSVAHLPLPQWQHFRDLQAGIRRNDPTAEDELYAIKRGLQLATKMLPADAPHDSATNYRAELVEEINTERRATGRNPDDRAIRNMILRRPPPGSQKLELVQNRFPRNLGSTPSERDFLDERMEKLRRDLEIDPVAKMIPGGRGAGAARLPGMGKAPTGPGVTGGGGRSVGTGSSTVKNAPGGRSADTIGAAGGRTIGIGAPAPSSPTLKATAAPKTTSAPSHAGKSSGQAIGDRLSGGTSRTSPGGDAPRSSTWSRNSPTRPPGTNEHHDIVQKSWNPNRERKPWWTFSKEARDYFDSKTITVKSSDHKYNAEHRAYNATVRTAIEKHLAGPPKVDPETMSLKGAKALYRAVMRNPDVRAFRKKMLESNEQVRKQHPMWMDGQ